MSEIPYPKMRYKGVEVKPGTPHTENPGFIYKRVTTPEEEGELGEGWYDSPREAVEAFHAGGAPHGDPSAGNGEALIEREPGQPAGEWPVESEKAQKKRRH